MGKKRKGAKAGPLIDPFSWAGGSEEGSLACVQITSNSTGYHVQGWRERDSIHFLRFPLEISSGNSLLRSKDKSE